MTGKLQRQWLPEQVADWLKRTVFMTKLAMVDLV